MVQARYDLRASMAEARSQYFEVNQFGLDGGYGDAWVDFKLGPFPFPFPNTKARVRALQYHDLHHIVTGYDTDFVGELEISAWEIGGGCGDFWAAWFLNLGGLAAGTVRAPLRTLRAFVRGRRSRTLYGSDLSRLLERSVGDVRAELGTDREATPAHARDLAALALYVTLGWVCALVFFVFGLALLPLGFLSRWLRTGDKFSPDGARVG